MFFLQAQKDMNIQVKNDSQEQIGKDRHLTVNQDLYTAVKGDVHDTVNGTRKIEIKADDNLTVDGKAATHISGSYSLKVDSDVAEKFASNHSEEAGQALYLKAGMNVVIEAGVDLSLKVGGSFIDISNAGVTISGPMVLINSGGSAGSGTACNLVSSVAPKLAQLPITTKPTDVAALLSQSPLSASGGSSAGAGAGGGAPAGPRHDPTSDENKDKTHWVEVVLVDDAGQPLAGESYEIKLPDGSIATGTTDENGKGRVENIDPGSVDISFPELDKDAWEPV
jgi:type VI secretion system secreted protein VgrG